jgi:hypothetical protein
MDTWADLHGEPETGHVDILDYCRKPKNSIWCDNCQAWVERTDLKRWTGDDSLHWLCPGCDADLLEPENME